MTLSGFLPGGLAEISVFENRAVEQKRGRRAIAAPDLTQGRPALRHTAILLRFQYSDPEHSHASLLPQNTVLQNRQHGRDAMFLNRLWGVACGTTRCTDEESFPDGPFPETLSFKGLCPGGRLPRGDPPAHGRLPWRSVQSGDVPLALPVGSSAACLTASLAGKTLGLRRTGSTCPAH